MAEKRTTSARAKNTPKSQMKSRSSSGSKSSSRTASKKKQNTAPSIDNTFSRQVTVVVLFSLCVLFVFVSFIKGSGIWEKVHSAVYGFFGFPAVLWFVSLLIITVFIAQEKPVKTVAVRSVWLFVLLLLISAGITAFTVKNANDLSAKEIIDVCREEGKNHSGAGAFGGATGGVAVKYLGKAGAIIIWLLSVFVFVMITTKTSVAQLIELISKPFDGAKEMLEERKIRVNEERTRREEAVQDTDRERRINDRKKHYRLIEESEKGANMLVDDDEDYAPVKSKRNSKIKSKEFAENDEFDEELDEKYRVLYKAYSGEEAPEEKKKSKKPKVRYLGSSPDLLETGPQNPTFNQKTQVNEPEAINTEEEVEQTDPGLDEIIRKVGAPIQNKTSEKTSEKKITKADEITLQAENVAEEIAKTEASKPAEKEEYVFPPIDLLKEAKNESIDMTAELRENAKRLIATLEEYGVKASVSDISRGPTVTRFEIVPAPGVKISKITTLANDIKLRLAAKSVRIEAPIPGKAAVGIEIPNTKRNTVSIRELIDSDTFRNAKGSLACVLGKDIEGNIITCDLTKMPHLLIAGSTGSGKSVCVNSMLISLMYKYTPEELKLVLVDPKKVEFEIYNGIPHLLVPVVSNAKKAAGVLQWAVVEMEKRYEMLQGKNVRSLNSYNELAEKTGEFEKLSKIVIVIDEMADLMQTTPKEVEDSIARLAAMARAAGMHIILATQRPSVDVITGTIKNNIPSRIALTVSSRIDSQTILGAGGAETLIGYGDMLYNPMGVSTPKRVQGCFVSDEEVGDVIGFLKRNGDAEYDESITEEIERKAAENEKGKGADASNDGGGFHDEDPTMSKAIEAVIQAGQASVSLLQRKLGVGYARAGKLIDQLEERGIVGPYEGSKPRKVLMTRTQWLEMNMSSSEPIAIDGSFEENTLPFDIDDAE